MSRRHISDLAILIYILVVIALLLMSTFSQVQADDSSSEMLPVDAKLGHCITVESGSEMAAVDVKLANYISDDFEYAAAADAHAFA